MKRHDKVYDMIKIGDILKSKYYENVIIVTGLWIGEDGTHVKQINERASWYNLCNGRQFKNAPLFYLKNDYYLLTDED